jgi:hypothetical protein
MNRVAYEGKRTNSSVLGTGCVVIERIKANGRVVGAGRQAESASSPSAVFWPG